MIPFMFTMLWDHIMFIVFTLFNSYNKQHYKILYYKLCVYL